MGVSKRDITRMGVFEDGHCKRNPFAAYYFNNETGLRKKLGSFPTEAEARRAFELHLATLGIYPSLDAPPKNKLKYGTR